MTLSHIFVYKTRLLYCLHIEVTWSGANTITVNQVIQSTITSYQWSKQYTQGEKQCQIYLQPHLCQKFFLLSKNFCHFCGKKISKTIENDFPTFTKLPNAPIVNFFNKIILNAWFPRWVFLLHRSCPKQKDFLGGGMVKNRPHSLKLILLPHTDTGLGKFTWSENFLAPVIYFQKTKSWLFIDFGAFLQFLVCPNFCPLCALLLQYLHLSHIISNALHLFSFCMKFINAK